MNFFFDTLKSKNSIKDNQIIGIIFKIKYNDEDKTIKSLSTYRKGLISSKVKFTTLFKHLANIRSEDYSNNDMKIESIIFTYHIYPIDYDIKNIDQDLIILEIIH